MIQQLDGLFYLLIHMYTVFVVKFNLSISGYIFLVLRQRVENVHGLAVVYQLVQKVHTKHHVPQCKHENIPDRYVHGDLDLTPIWRKTWMHNHSERP